MTFKQKILYLLAVIGIYVLLYLLEGFLLPLIVEIFTTADLPLIIIKGIFLLIVNPYLTYRIAELIPFKIGGLKVADGLEADLKKDVRL